LTRLCFSPDGLSRFEELSYRQAARTAIPYAFDLIAHNGKDLRNLHCWTGRQRAMLRLASCSTSTSPGMVLSCSGLGPRASFPRRSMAPGPCRVWIKARNPASIVQRERSEIRNR
jgi:hypothetical protein